MSEPSQARPHGLAQGQARREFLQVAGVAAAGVLGSSSLAAEAAPAALLPQIKLGQHSISRLICGANPFNAGSHLSSFVNNEMRSYYTNEQILKTLRRCIEVGINCFQSTRRNLDVYQQLVAEGGKMKFLSIEAKDTEVLGKLAAAGCIGVAHHGEHTDRLFKDGKLDEVNEYLKRIRDTGMAVGVSTHMPAVVDAIESKGWDLDYYMTCVYERHRSEADLLKLMGHVPLPVGEVYLKSDPPRMFKAVQQTRRVCFAFKILAAGRLSDRKQLVEQAFRDTYAAIKPGDGVIIGMYDRYSDQPAENAAYVRKYAGGATS